MSVQNIKLLHVEDNVADRLLTARLLGTMKEYNFIIVRAATEITAVAELNKGGVEFVILDYKLPLGDGLGCLRKLRQIDAVVPIIVVSGVTTPEIGAECRQAGADDYLSKQDLTGEKLAVTVRRGFSRAGALPGVRAELVPLCKYFVDTLGDDFFKALDDVEKVFRQAEMNPGQVKTMFENVVGELDRTAVKSSRSYLTLARPILLEIIERLTAKAPAASPKPTQGSRTGV